VEARRTPASVATRVNAVDRYYWLGEYLKTLSESLLTLGDMVDTKDCAEGETG
jgi:hypothetical protein